MCMLACRSPASLLSGVGEMETMGTLCGELAKMGGGSWRKRSRQQERKSEKKKIAEDEHKGKEKRFKGQRGEGRTEVEREKERDLEVRDGRTVGSYETFWFHLSCTWIRHRFKIPNNQAATKYFL